MNQYKLLWWEWEEILHHFETRPDIWVPDEDRLTWSRKDQRDFPGETALTLVAVPPQGKSKVRMYTIQVLPATWSPDICEDYFRTLILQWSTYGERLELQEMLGTEVGLTPQQAFAAAIISGYISNVGTLRNDEINKGDFHEDWAHDPYMPGHYFGAFPLTQGGQVRLYSSGKELLRTVVHLTAQDGRDLELRGYLHPIGHPLGGLHYELYGVTYEPDGSGNERSPLRTAEPV